jgi:hypothetical protein
MFFLLYEAVQSVKKRFSMFGTGQKLSLQDYRFKPFTALKTKRWIVTIVAKKDVQDLEVSDGMVSILRRSMHALSCSV